MLLSQALDVVHKFSPKEFAVPSDLQPTEIINQCLADTGTVKLQIDPST